MKESQLQAVQTFKRRLMSALARPLTDLDQSPQDNDMSTRILTRVAARIEAAPPPIIDHRRDLLFGLSTSALVADNDEDLLVLVRDQFAAAFAVGRSSRLWEIAPRELVEWMRKNLFFDLPFEADQWRRFMLSAGEVLALAERTGDIVPDTSWTAIRVRTQIPVDPAGDTVKNVGASKDTTSDDCSKAADAVDELRALPDPRIAEYFLIHTCCGQSPDELAVGYDVAPQEISDALAAAKTWLAKSRTLPSDAVSLK